MKSTKEQLLAKKREYERQRINKIREAGRCTRCCRSPAVVGRVCCAVCLEKERQREGKVNKKRKDLVRAHYGNKCTCCGETEQAFLTLDHSNDDGSKRRLVEGSGTRLYKWIIRNNFPPDLQILCFNCNLGRYINGGVCPHQLDKR